MTKHHHQGVAHYHNMYGHAYLLLLGKAAHDRSLLLPIMWADAMLP